MSKEIMELVIGKAILELDFRDALFANPDQTLGGYELTPAEKIRLKHMDYDTLEALARALIIPINKEATVASA